MKPEEQVVQAAIMWVQAIKEDPDEWASDEDHALIDAVKALTTAPAWEDLLADPTLTFGGSELLPHLLANAPVADCIYCRPGIYCPTHTPRMTNDEESTVSLIFTFQNADEAERFDLSRLGVVTGGSDDGLTMRVEPEDEWATADNLNLLLMVVGLYQHVMVTEEVPSG